MRDGLSLLDQAIAHGENGAIDAEQVRDMLGLADRGRVLDLFEKVMGGDAPRRSRSLSELYDRGADPLAVMQDLLEIVHFLTRVKVAPGAEGFFDGGSGEAKRAAEMAGKLSVPSLTRAWQMLLKGLFEVRDATRPIAACEMALIRLAYAADLPPTDKLVRELLDGESRPRGSLAPAGGEGRKTSDRALPIRTLRGRAPPRLLQPVRLRMLSARQNPPCRPRCRFRFAPSKTSPHSRRRMARRCSRCISRTTSILSSIEPGRLEFRPSAARAAHAGRRPVAEAEGLDRHRAGSVSIAREGGAPTLAEQKKAAKAAQLESVHAGTDGARSARPLPRRRNRRRAQHRRGRRSRRGGSGTRDRMKKLVHTAFLPRLRGRSGGAGEGGLGATPSASLTLGTSPVNGGGK